MIAAQLGLKEWGRGMLGLSKDKSGRWDFFFLTILLMLTLTLGLLLLGTREGVLNRFMDVSLGYVKDFGIPVWVYAEFLDTEGEVIDAKLLDRLAKLTGDADTKFYPYREVEWNRVRLPGYESTDQFGNPVLVWKENDKRIDISARAVHFDDPLWRLFTSTEDFTTMPLAVVLSKELFKRHFSCDAYIRSLDNRIPPNAMEGIRAAYVREGSGALGCLDTGVLWLNLKVHFTRREMHPFQFFWAAPRIPAMEEVAFLFPLTTFHAITLSERIPKMQYFAEGEGKRSERIGALEVWADDETPGLREKIDAFVKCLWKAKVTGKHKDKIKLDHMLQGEWIQACGNHGLAIKYGSERMQRPFIKVVESAVSHEFSAPNAHALIVPCVGLDRVSQRDFGCLASGQDEIEPDARVEVDMQDIIGGYRFAQLFVKNRDELFDTVQLISKGSDGTLALRPEYEDAIIRFAFINDMIKVLRGAFVWVFGAFLVILLVVQISLVITHRRHNYGVFLANGMLPGQVVFMVLLQVVVSYLVAFGFAYEIFELIRGTLADNVEVMLTLTNYREHIDISDPDLLPLSGRDVLRPGGLGLLVTVAVTTIIMCTVLSPWPLPRSPEPAKLLYS